MFKSKNIVFLVLTLVIGCHCFPKHYGNFTEFSSIRSPDKPQQTYRPVVLMHGLKSSPKKLETMADFIRKEHPGTKVYNLHVYDDTKSVSHPMWTQVDKLYSTIKSIMEEATNGIHLIGYSQGGLIARGMLEKYNHNVHTFISLSSPQAGQYGDAVLEEISMIRESAYRLFYRRFMQNHFSVANYWNDPHHQDLYYKFCNFLPYINNELKGSENATYTKNFNKLENLVLIGGPDDGVIEPWQSSHFSFYDEHENVIDFRKRSIYTDDLFGLKSLDEAGKISIFEVENVHHVKWHENMEVLKKFIVPWLD